LGSKPDIGTPYREIVRFAKSLGYDVSVQTHMSIDELRGIVQTKQTPVIIALQAWSGEDEKLPWRDRWEDGHYVVVIGFGDGEDGRKRVFFMDPSTLGNYTYVPEDEFMERWHDEDSDEAKTRLVRFGIALSKPKVVFDPFVATRMD